MSETGNMLRAAAITGAMVTGGIVATKGPPCPEPSPQPLQMIRELVNDQRNGLNQQRRDLETREQAIRNLPGKPGEIEQTIRELQNRNNDLQTQVNQLTKENTELKSKPPCPPGKVYDKEPPKPLAKITAIPERPIAQTIITTPATAEPIPTPYAPDSLIVQSLIMGTQTPTDAIYPGVGFSHRETAATPLPSAFPTVGLALGGLYWLRKYWS